MISRLSFSITIKTYGLTFRTEICPFLKDNICTVYQYRQAPADHSHTLGSSTLSSESPRHSTIIPSALSFPMSMRN
jgi:hypothetical protein